MLKIEELCVNLHGIFENCKRMKQIKTIYYMLAALLLLASCKSEDSYEATLYNDAAITAFSLGTVNRYIDGVKKTYAGSDYEMKINALEHLIQNTDSLPIYTDAAHIVCSISTKNNGVVFIKSLSSDEYSYYNSTDSIDFSNKDGRQFRILASDGSGYTDYTVKVNVHKEDGDLMVWQLQSSAPWDDVAPNEIIKQWLGQSTYEEYALSTENKVMARYIDGTTWVQDIADDHEDIAMLPKKDMSLTSYKLLTADSTDYVLMAGTVDGAKTAVWRKIVDNKGKQPKGEWCYIDRGTETAGLLPVLSHLQIFSYDGVVLALGGDYKTIYESRDNGITWKSTKRITLPAEFDYTATNVEVRVDDDKYIWLKCTGGDNQIWRGRLNRLGWKK